MQLEVRKVRVPKAFRAIKSDHNLSVLVRDELDRFLQADKNKVLGDLYRVPVRLHEGNYTTAVKVDPTKKAQLDRYKISLSSIAQVAAMKALGWIS